MSSFKNIMYAEDLVKMKEAYEQCLQHGTNENWTKYMQGYWKCKEKWVLAYRNEEVRGHQTNNFAETRRGVLEIGYVGYRCYQ